MKKSLGLVAACALLLCAAWGLGQSADKNTAAPTANQLQLRLIEPAEGASITGRTVRVTVGYNLTVFGQGQGTRFGEPNFPHPIFDVFLDNELRQTLKGGEGNVSTIENVPPGNHKIVVMAKNISGEVIDRKEVNVVTVETPIAAAAPAERPRAAEIERRETTDRATAPPPPAPPPAAPETEPALPATGSSYPRLALMGLALVLTGLGLARRAR